MLDDAHEVIARFLPAMVTDDRDVLGELVADDIVWYTPPSTILEQAQPPPDRSRSSQPDTERFEHDLW